VMRNTGSQLRPRVSARRAASSSGKPPPRTYRPLLADSRLFIDQSDQLVQHFQRATTRQSRRILLAILRGRSSRRASGAIWRAFLDEVDEIERTASMTRLNDLFSVGVIPYERFSEVLDQILGATSHADLEGAMLALPPLVRLTPTLLRMTTPLIVRAAEGCLNFGSGWQLAADTTIRTGVGTTRVDLTSARWDAQDVTLRLETWGSIEVFVPKGVAIQLAGGSRPVELRSISPAIPGGPVLRVSTYGPTGWIRMGHTEGHDTRRALHRKPRRRASRRR
jgi:hypothetical protein